jgi:hypothetical protein
MIQLRFPTVESERRAMGLLAGRFPFKTWATGEMLVPESALPFLASEGILFSVEGPAKYEQSVPAIRNPLAPAV